MDLRADMTAHAKEARVCNDLTQEAYLSCLEEESSYTGDFEEFFLFHLNRVTCREYYTDNMSLEAEAWEDTEDLLNEYAGGETPEDSTSNVQTRDEVVGLAKTEQDKVLLALLYDGHTQAEIAFLLSITPSAVSHRLSKYRREV